MVSNANTNGLAGAPVIGQRGATTNEVLAVDAGTVGLYYPGMLNDVDGVLGTALSMGAVGVMPAFNTSLAGVVGAVVNVPGLTNAGVGDVLWIANGGISAGVLSFARDGYYGDATLDRIACRTLETYYTARQMVNWFASLTAGVNSNQTLFFDWGGGKNKPMPKFGAEGAGLTEAPRGALGHWIKIGWNKTHKSYNGKVHRYQIITPTAWNVSPIDTGGGIEKRSPGNPDTTIGTNNEHGPIEESIMGAPVLNDAEPIEILRIVHSFDPCIACTVHVINAKGKKVAKIKVDPSF
jgi:hypothetical protein